MAIQTFLDGVEYSAEPVYRSPRSVLADGKAHCFDGALLAACALERHGDPPLVVDLRAVRDDDHVIAVFRRRRHWGAIAKSNVVGLRYREPIYRDLRELAMSYFEVYYNTDGEKTLRSYSDALDLGRYDAIHWRTRDGRLSKIAAQLDREKHHALLTPAMVRALSLVDERSYDAGLLGVNVAGLYAAERLKKKGP